MHSPASTENLLFWRTCARWYDRFVNRAFPEYLDIVDRIVADATPSDRLLEVATGTGNVGSLLLQEMRAIVRHVRTFWRVDRIKPSEMMVLIFDLRSQVGVETATYFHDPVEVQATIQDAVGRGRHPAMNFPLHLDGGVTIVDTFVPELSQDLRERPPGTMPIVLVDSENAAALVCVGRASRVASA